MRVGVAQGADAFEPVRGARAHARGLRQRRFIGGEHAADAAEALVQFVRQRVDIAAGNGVKQQKLQKLVRPERLRAVHQRAAAQALAVAGVRLNLQ